MLNSSFQLMAFLALLIACVGCEPVSSISATSSVSNDDSSELERFRAEIETLRNQITSDKQANEQLESRLAVATATDEKRLQQLRELRDQLDSIKSKFDAGSKELSALRQLISETLSADDKSQDDQNASKQEVILETVEPPNESNNDGSSQNK